MLRPLVLVALLGPSIWLPTASAVRRLRQNFDNNLIENDQIIDDKFMQLRNHSNPAEGKFEQRYYFTDKYYKGQGSPIIIEIAGEESAEGLVGDLAGDSLMIAMMKAWGAAGVVLEHRYFGQSIPRKPLTTSNLKLHTVEQAIEDYKYFVENVKLPWTSGNYSAHHSSTPWVSIGCSYPGLLVALIQQQYPDLLAAGWSSSAPINADGNFRDYWEPIKAGMPKNCSSDLAAVVDHIDDVVSTGTPKEVKELKTRFGLPDLADDDFGGALLWPLLQWQRIIPGQPERQADDFHEFCDKIEAGGASSSMDDPRGVGMDKALENLEKEFRDSIAPKLINSGLFPTSNPQLPLFTDTSISNESNRAWVWLLCTQLGWFQVGGARNTSSIATSLVSPDYFERQCSNYFPLADGTHPKYSLSEATSKFNSRFKSWNFIGKNLFITNGEFDPWRSVSFSSKRAPPNDAKTETHQITVIPNAIHGWDLSLSNGKFDENVQRVQDDGIAQIRDWLQQWYKKHPNVPISLTAEASTSGPEDPAVETSNEINATHGTIPNHLEDEVEAMAAMKGWDLNFS